MISASSLPEALIGNFLGSSRNPGFEHISVVCHNFIADFRLSLMRTTQIYVVDDGTTRTTP